MPRMIRETVDVLTPERISVVLDRDEASPENTRAELGDVQVNFQDAVLSEIFFQEHGDEGFLQFSFIGFIRFQKQVLHHLLTDGAGPPRIFPLLVIGDQCVLQLLPVKSIVLIKPAVFRDERQFPDKLGYGIQGQPFLPEQVFRFV